MMNYWLPGDNMKGSDYTLFWDVVQAQTKTFSLLAICFVCIWRA